MDLVAQNGGKRRFGKVRTSFAVESAVSCCLDSLVAQRARQVYQRVYASLLNILGCSKLDMPVDLSTSSKQAARVVKRCALVEPELYARLAQNQGTNQSSIARPVTVGQHVSRFIDPLYCAVQSLPKHSARFLNYSARACRIRRHQGGDCFRRGGLRCSHDSPPFLFRAQHNAVAVDILEDGNSSIVPFLRFHDKFDTFGL